jgi:hypothetical protein
VLVQIESQTYIMNTSQSDFATELRSHRLDFSAGDDTLIISFDNAGAPHREQFDRRPWGHKFFSEEGHSVLGIIARASDWYRCDSLHRALLDLCESGFFRRFRSITLTGSSMGGYGATAFASLFPGCNVISFNPQSTLRRDLVPWDTAHKNGMKQDWTGLFSDGAAEVATASKVYIFYDPFHPLDRRHAARYSQQNVRLMRAPMLGHGLPDAYLEMGMLKEIMRRGIAGDLTDQWYYAAIRKRRTLPRYFKHLAVPLAAHGRSRQGQVLMSRAFDLYRDPYFQYREAIFTAANGQLEKAMTILDQVSRTARQNAKKRKKQSLAVPNPPEP